MRTETSGPPRVGRFRQWFGASILKLAGWTVTGEVTQEDKVVVIFAPHTTNWDFIVLILMAYHHGISPTWIGKQELFWGPLKYFFRALGGIPIIRQANANNVESIANTIKQEQRIFLGISPEGTRSKTNHWKTGFYHIARLAETPIEFAYLDYEKKETGFAPGFMPSGDIQNDIQFARDFFKDFKGKYAHNFSDIIVKAQKS